MSFKCRKKSVAETCSCNKLRMKCTYASTLIDCENDCEDENERFDDNFNKAGDSWGNPQEYRH